MRNDSRSKILEFLKHKGEGSATELSLALGLTPVTIRHHLQILRAEQLVDDPVPKRKLGPGRPEMIFKLTPLADESLPRNYDLFCRYLLSTMQASISPKKLEDLLSQAGSRMGREIAGHERPSLAVRLRKAMDHLSLQCYLPHSETDSKSLTITLANCPYLEAARSIPGLCSFDAALLEALLSSKIILLGRIIAGDRVCTLRVELP